MSQRVALWSLLLVAVAALLRRGWVQLFGPVLFYELLRIGRRGRYVIVRCLYALALLVFLLLVYSVWADTVRIVHGAMAPRDMANFAASFFYVFAGMQLSMVIFLTPAYTAGVLAEEKERGTLEALLATDLRNREIVLGLFLARLINLTLLLLTGLPILSFLQFLGGVDPNLVVSAYVATGCTMLSLASISFLCSLYACRSRDAIVRSYLLSLGYLVASGSSWLLLLPQLQLASFPSTDNWLSPITLRDVVEGFNCGNIVSLSFGLASGVLRGGNLSVLLWDAMTKYAWFHGLIAVGCCAWAVLRLRAKALEQLGGDLERRNRLGGVQLGLLPLRDRPILWKEVAVEAGSLRGLAGLLVNGCLLAVVALPVLHVIYYHGRAIATEPGSRLTDLINLWVRGASMLLGSLLLLQVAVRAAGSVSGEYGRKTLDGVLATTLENREILAGKWLGSIFGPRRPWLGLAVVWSIGLATGALHPLAPVCFVGAWLVYAAFVSALGLWASVANRSTHRATFWTLFLLAAAMLASWLAAFDVAGRWLKEPEAVSLSPPLALGLLTFSPADVKIWAEPGSQWSFRGVVLGLAGWGLATAVLWAVTKVRFRVVTGREAVAEIKRATALIPTLTPAPTLIPTPNPTLSPALPGFRAAARAQISGVGVREDPPRRRFPVRAWLGLGIRTGLALLPLALLMGEYVRLDWAADERLRDSLAETYHLDPGWRLDELEANREFVPPEQNSALQIQRAMDWIPRDWQKDPQDISFDKVAPERQLNAKQLAMLRTRLERVRTALVEARRLADMPRGRFRTEVAQGEYWANRYPDTQQASSVGTLLGHDADLRAQEGDIDSALVSCRALLNSGRAIGDEPQFLSQIVRWRLQQHAILKMERVIAQGEPTAATLEALQRLLADEDRHRGTLIALRSERAGIDLMLEALQNGTNVKGNIFQAQRGNATIAPLPHDEELRLMAAGSLKGQRAALLRAYNDLVEAAKLPPEQMPARLRQVITGLRTANTPMAFGVFMGPWRLEWSDQNALVRSAVVALAAERYRFKHGRLPDTLEALVPSFLPHVPLDPYDGKRLRYRRLKDGVVIYSIGPDLTDNSGNLDRQNRTRSGTDVGVQLWEVNRRRQPPAAEKPN
jgi:ABC-type transport system involved in multi-copper enzyme maturation permease subunit